MNDSKQLDTHYTVLVVTAISVGVLLLVFGFITLRQAKVSTNRTSLNVEAKEGQSTTSKFSNPSTEYYPQLPNMLLPEDKVEDISQSETMMHSGY